jgi:hypothetical protein
VAIILSARSAPAIQASPTRFEHHPDQMLYLSEDFDKYQEKRLVLIRYFAAFGETISRPKMQM